MDTEQAIQAHSTEFYSKFNSNLADKDHTAYPMPDEMLMKITDFLLQIKDSSTVGQLKQGASTQLFRNCIQPILAVTDLINIYI